MSVPYHLELFNNGNVRLYVNFSKIKGGVADENMTMHFYATNSHGIPIFTEQLGIAEMRSLYSHLDSISIIKDGAKKSGKFIETTEEINLLLAHLKESELNTILQLLAKFESDEKIKGLLESLSDLEIENLIGAYHHKRISIELKKLEQLIALEEKGNIVEDVKNTSDLAVYSAGQGERIFQNWIESNLWIFGVDYIRKHDSRKIALLSEGDILMESADGYLDLIELKRPNTDLLKFDSNHKCYYPHPELAQVIGQSLFYLQKLSEYKLNLEKDYKTKVIMPRIKIIAGRSNGFSEDQKDCIRMINSNLNSIKIQTYDDLLLCGQLLIKANEHSKSTNY
jgi:hypothetical protein